MVRDRDFYRTIFRISLPAAFSALVSFLVVVADDIMVSYIDGNAVKSALARAADAICFGGAQAGRVFTSDVSGVAAQSAVSQINALTAFITATLFGLVSGSSVLISQYWGKRDIKRIKRIFSVVLLISVGVAVLFAAAATIFPEAIVSLVVDKSETEVVNYALGYFAIICFSWIPFAVTTALTGMLRSIEVVRVTLYVSICSLFVNIGLNYVLIFGRLGFEPMGVEGAAIATLITRIIEMAIVWVYTFKVQKGIDIKPKDLLIIDGALAKDYVKYGLPVGLTDMQWSLIGMLKAAIIGQMGKTFIAANNITNSMMNLGTMFTFALAGGACVVVGKAVGRGDYKTAREYSKTIQIMFALIAVVMAGVVFLLRKPFTGLYGSADNAQVFELSTVMIAIGAATLLGTSYHAACFIGINRGAGDSRFVATVDMICGWLIVLPATLLAAFVFHWPLPIVFLMTRIDQCFKWIIAFFRLRGNKWIKNVTRAN